MMRNAGLLWKLGRTGLRWQSAAAQLSARKASLEVTLGGTPVDVSHRWLRDHCTCHQCYNHTTNQRRLQPDQLPPSDALAPEAIVEEQDLRVSWPDGHRSSYSLSWLERALAGGGSPREGVLTRLESWSGEELKAVGGPRRRSAVEVLGREAGQREVLGDLLRTGLALVEGASATDGGAETRALAEAVAPLERTFYGEFWVVDPTAKGDLETFADTAYTSEAIGSHTDSTYYRNTPGVQVFHILQPSPDGGGANIFVDGARAVEELGRTDPAALRLLAAVPVTHHYLGPEANLRCTAPVVTLGSEGELVQLRYNPYDRAPLEGLGAAAAEEWYEAYRALQAVLKDPRLEWRVALQPGQVLFVDNWRCTHARDGFKGRRLLAGCYLSRDHFLSRARAMGL